MSSSYLVRHYMETEVVSSEGDISVVEAAKQMSKVDRGYMIILERGHPVGIATEHDFVKKVIALELDPAKVKISEIMTKPLITVDPDEDLVKASEMMKKYNVRRLPVVKTGIIYGMLTSTGISKHFVDYLDKSSRDIMRWCNVLD